jgi:hypothetical protein
MNGYRRRAWPRLGKATKVGEQLTRAGYRPGPNRHNMRRRVQFRPRRTSLRPGGSLRLAGLPAPASSRPRGRLSRRPLSFAAMRDASSLLSISSASATYSAADFRSSACVWSSRIFSARPSAAPIKQLMAVCQILLGRWQLRSVGGSVLSVTNWHWGREIE